MDDESKLKEIAACYDDREGALNMLNRARSAKNRNLINGHGFVYDEFVQTQKEMHRRRLSNKLPSRLSILEVALDTSSSRGYTPLGGPGGRGMNRQNIGYHGSASK